jgi:enediyne biosynthesis protein E4
MEIGTRHDINLRVRWPLLVGGLVLCGSLLLAAAAQAQPFFTEVAPRNPYGIPYNDYRGSALGDYDNDGWIDLFFSGWETARMLPVHNEGNGRFADHRAAIQAEIRNGTGGGVSFGDYDRDGDLDLFRPSGLWTSFDQNQLLRNDRGVYVDVTIQAGLVDAVPTDNAIWLDYNKDGYLDLYTGNPGCQNTEPIQNTTNLLYRNNGDGTFTDVTAAAGLAVALGVSRDDASGGECSHGSNGGLAAEDFNDDGWPDLYVGVWGDRNRLFLGDGKGGFQDATTGPLGDLGQAFDLAVGDVDNDGDLDVVQTNQDKGPLLLVNLGGGQFQETAAAAGLPTLAVPLNAYLVDVENDGDLDVVFMWSPFQLFLNQGDGTFVERTADSGIPNGLDGGMLADYDRDGFVDLLTTSKGNGGRFFRGIDNGNHWLQVELVGRQSDGSGIGARVIATAGDLRQVRPFLGGKGYDQEERISQFGLGTQVQVDVLEIHWPSGQVDRLTAIPADQRIRVIEGQGTYQTVQPSRWESLTDSLVAGASASFTAAVRPTRFEPEARITRVVADLSGLGGPAAVPLSDRGNGLYALAPQPVSAGATPGWRRISVWIDQETSLGSRWTLMSREIGVFPAADMLFFDDGLAAGWQVGTVGSVEVDLEEGQVVKIGAKALAIQSSKSRPWTVKLATTTGVDPFGYTALSFVFHPGTATGNGLNVLVNNTRKDLLSRVDLANPAWQEVSIPLDSLGLAAGAAITSLSFSGNLQGTLYLDQVRLVHVPVPIPATAVLEEQTAALPKGFALEQNYPNPFNSATVICFALPAREQVELVLYNLAGQRVMILARGVREAGTHTVSWDGKDGQGRALASGVYLYRLRAGGQEQTRKLLLLR